MREPWEHSELESWDFFDDQLRRYDDQWLPVSWTPAGDARRWDWKAYGWEPVKLHQCATCGAVVGDTELHLQFHKGNR